MPVVQVQPQQPPVYMQQQGEIAVRCRAAGVYRAMPAHATVGARAARAVRSPWCPTTELACATPGDQQPATRPELRESTGSWLRGCHGTSSCCKEPVSGQKERGFNVCFIFVW